MKIAIVCLNLSWQAGGVRLIYSFAHALMKLGHRVVIYAPEINESAYPDLRKGLDIRVITSPMPIAWQYVSDRLIGRTYEKLARGRALSAAGRKIAEAMDADFDIVTLHDFSYGLASIYKRKNPRAKIIWTMNDPPYMYLPKDRIMYDIASRVFNWYKDIAERNFFRFIDSVVVLVERNKAWAEERGMKGKVVWSGLEFEKFYAAPKKFACKKEFTIFGVGALNKYRRFEDIVDAIKILRDRSHNVRAVIVCKNIWKENECMDMLLARARDVGVEQYIDFRFDGASDDELEQLYAMSDFFVLPIHLPPPRDGFGWQLVPFEAMAAGTPVIASRKIDITEALADGETACFVDPLSPVQIAEKIEMLIKNPDLYFKIATDGQEFVKTKMSWEAYAKEVIVDYHKNMNPIKSRDRT